MFFGTVKLPAQTDDDSKFADSHLPFFRPSFYFLLSPFSREFKYLSQMARFLSAILLFSLSVFGVQAMPLFDADLAASPLLYDVRLSYRAGPRMVTDKQARV
ncbi:hypothetical protein CLU79DRAFT_884259 [Phycomyces nitens]|nr:hypothetical protein CLU79DRAFT_884259 [Phycomyces nitens]